MLVLLIIFIRLQGSSPTRCANNYTMACVKRDVLGLLDALDGERSYEIYPGFTLHQKRIGPGTSSSPVSNDELAAQDAANVTQLDHMIVKRLSDYVESIDLRVKLLNPIDKTARSVGTTVLQRILPFLRMSTTKYKNIY